MQPSFDNIHRSTSISISISISISLSAISILIIPWAYLCPAPSSKDPAVSTEESFEVHDPFTAPGLLTILSEREGKITHSSCRSVAFSFYSSKKRMQEIAISVHQTRCFAYFILSQSIQNSDKWCERHVSWSMLPSRPPKPHCSWHASESSRNRSCITKVPLLTRLGRPGIKMPQTETVESLLSPSLRVSRPVAACSRCRSAKIKCDGKLPACTACEKAGKVLSCSSANDEFARGKERSYVAALEGAYERLQKQIAELKTGRRPANVPDDSVDGPKSSQSAGRAVRKEALDVDDLVGDFGFL